jgi:uncharacterized protein YlxP (DUF503 family)
LSFFVCVVELELHLPRNRSLKEKRKELTSLKARVRQRFGAAVAETDHHELWQRATLTAALVGNEPGPLRERGWSLGRYAESSFPDGTRVQCRLLSGEDLPVGG